MKAGLAQSPFQVLNEWDVRALFEAHAIMDADEELQAKKTAALQNPAT